MDAEVKNFWENRGQVATWVIIAIVLVAVILLFFFVEKEINPVNIITGLPEFSPEDYLEQCIEEHTKDVTSIMLKQGGFVEPLNYKVFNDSKVEYLCENAGHYNPCVNQHPVLIREMEAQIKNYLDEKIDLCFSNLVEEAKKHEIEATIYSGKELDVNFGQDKIFIDLKKSITLKEKGQTRTYEEFNFEAVNSAYNLALIALEIAAQEADYCYFEYVGYKILYPRYSVIPYTTSDSTVIYQIHDTKSQSVMYTAIRSCAIPPGF